MMMKRIVYLLLMLFPAMLMEANTRTGLRNWEDGPLTWNDFKGTSVIPNSPSYIKPYLQTISTEKTENKKVQLRLTTEASIDPSLSFADTASRTDQRLRYHQLQFDQLELYRRKLQNDLNTGMNGLEADKKLKYYQELYKSKLAKIAEETQKGENEHKLQEWEYYTRKGLEEIGLPPVPEIEPNDWCYGIYLGVGGAFPTSTIKDDFTGCFTFTAGLTGGYKRIKVKADISYGQPKFNNVNVFGIKDAAGHDLQQTINTYASYLGIGFAGGYSIIDTKNFTITPFVGMYWSNYGWNVANYEWIKDDTGTLVPKTTGTENKSLKSYSWMAGIDFDIKVHNHVSNTPLLFSEQREQLTSSVRITPYVIRGCYAKANPTIRGYQVGFTVAYVGLLRALHLK